MKILVCGGAGYIGSHLVRQLIRTTSHQVIIVDSLVAFDGKRPHIDPKAIFEKGDVRDADFLDSVFNKYAQIDVVIHMCASLSVPESVADPLKYYDNNVIGAIRMVQAMKRHNCKYIIFSSTAALFGTPPAVLKDGLKGLGRGIEPDAEIRPECPYGDTKHIMELLLTAVDKSDGIRSVCLRYFNACGAHEDGDIGFHEPATHLIPVILKVPLGLSEKIKIFGTDYPTPDGTCVRDYIHIIDLADAHIRAIDYLAKGGASVKLNLGVGKGSSVKEVIEVARKVTGHPIPAENCPRRPGDPAALFACPDKAKEVLGGWEAKYSLEESVRTAWNFMKTHKEMFH